MVEGYNARQLALDTGMVGVAKAVDRRKGGVVNGNATTLTNGVANHKVVKVLVLLIIFHIKISIFSCMKFWIKIRENNY